MPSESQRPRRLFLSGAVVAGACAALPTIAPAQNQAGRTPFVLVHGAWHGGWCWRRVSDRLTGNGHYVAAPTLSGLGERSHLAADTVTLTTHVDDVVNEIIWNDLDRVVLVGHSYGGMVITAAAERIRKRIAAIVYLDAFMPSDGQSVASYRSPHVGATSHAGCAVAAGGFLQGEREGCRLGQQQAHGAADEVLYGSTAPDRRIPDDPQEGLYSRSCLPAANVRCRIRPLPRR